MRALVLLLALALASPARADQAWEASYPEGPVWIGRTLYWAEMGADRVMAWDGGGAPTVFFEQQGCGPTAVARYREDEFLVLCHRDGSVLRIDAQARSLARIHEDADGNRLRNPNDASADGAGGVWFTDPGPFSAASRPQGALYHLGPDGRLSRHATGLAYGNGVHVAGDRLLLSEHLARRVLSYPLAEGLLGRPELLFNLEGLGLSRPDYPEAGPDGIEIGPDGTLWVAEYGAGRLLAWRPNRGLVATIAVPVPYVTNIGFGPGGLVAVTGSFINDRAPLPGAVWVLRADALAGAQLAPP